MTGKSIIHYLIDTPSGLAWHQDANGNYVKDSIYAVSGINMKNAPGGWQNSKIGYARSASYFGLVQSYATPLEFVKSTAGIIRNQYYTNAGIECQFTLLSFVYNNNPQPGDPTFELYYNGRLDLPKKIDKASESFKTNLIQGGLSSLLKSFEDTVFEIPCDGSIPENIKWNADGLLVDDTFFYDIIGVQLPLNNGIPLYAYALPCNYTNNLNDNFGMLHGDTNYDDVGVVGVIGTYQNYVSTSGNTIIGSVNQKTYTVSGTIVTQGSNSQRNAGYVPRFDLVLVPKLPYVNYNNPAIYLIENAHTETTGDVFTFSKTFTIPENVELIPMIYEHSFSKINIKSGTINFQFSSSANPARCWAITLFDLGKLLVQKICQAASTTNQTFNYGFNSTLLSNNLGFVAFSGDAARAAGNPDYQKFFNAIQINPNFPSQVVNYTYGPVIKTSLKDWFTSCSAIFCGALGVQKLAGQPESIFFESMQYVFNSTLDPAQLITLPEIANLEITPDETLFFKKLKIGYPEISDDQISGKFEYNTTLELYSPLISIDGDSTLEIISKYFTSSYIIQKLLADIGDTSSARNDSDNRIFIVNTDRTKSVQDYFDASFQSEGDQIFDDPNNSNMPIIPALNCQPVPLTIFDGNFLSINNDSSIFVFNQNTTATRALALSITGTLAGNQANPLTGLPADYVIFTLYKNGTVYQTQTFTKTTSSPTDNVVFTVTNSLSITYKDTFYLRATTSTGATVIINGGSSFVIDSGYFAVFTDSAITIQPGAYLQLIPFTNVEGISNQTINSVPRPVVSTGFQYFVYNTYQTYNNYNYIVDINGITKDNNLVDNLEIDVYYNGAPFATGNAPGGGMIGNERQFTIPLTGNKTLALGDIIYILADNTNQAAQITDADFRLNSTQINAFNLKRVLYDAITGVPTLVASDQPGAAYNIEGLTPARMLRNWMPYINGIFYMQYGSYLQFSKLDKNQYLSTTLAGVAITENANMELGTNGAPYFYSERAKFQTKVPWNFNSLFYDTANRHIAAPYNGAIIYGFPMDVVQEQPLNEMQSWDVRISSATKMSQLQNLEIDGLNYLNMSPNSIRWSKSNPVQFVPAGLVLDPRYNTKDMNQYWFNEQITNWIAKDNYFQPWQTNDTINLQFITRDLSSVSIQLYKCDGSLISTTAATLISNPAIIAPYNLFQISIPLSALAPGQYYLYGTIAEGNFISEGLDIQVNQPQTTLIEYSNSTNRESLVFIGTNFTPSIRVHTIYDNMIDVKMKGSFYVDEVQDISVINAINSEGRQLWIGLGVGVPDWVIQKMARILSFDNWTLDGIGYSLAENAKFEKQFTKGQSMKYWTVDIQLAKNTDGTGMTASGIDDDSSMMITIDTQYFGPNAGSMGDGTSIITEVTVN